MCKHFCVHVVHVSDFVKAGLQIAVLRNMGSFDYGMLHMPTQDDRVKEQDDSVINVMSTGSERSERERRHPNRSKYHSAFTECVVLISMKSKNPTMRNA